MSGWKVMLFRKFTVESNRTRLTGLGARQVQELFSYLLLFRSHPQARESLLETLWGDQSAERARKKLRQTLWRLQSTLVKQKPSMAPELLIDNDWIQIILPETFWIDAAEFEKIYDFVKGKRIHELSKSDCRKMQYANDLYSGNLLEGWYQDWCIFERERFQTMQLMLLDKLVQYCELHQKYDLGLSYATEILRYDHAYERAHQQLMRLYFLSGNRTQALHQYERCVMSLRKELDVEPSERTKQLFEMIRLDACKPTTIGNEADNSMAETPTGPALQAVLNRLQAVSKVLRNVEYQIEEEILTLSGTFSDSI
jgi:DNA-binding SARP family transcriptional activator